MWDFISTIVGWLLRLFGARQSSKEVQAQNIGESVAEQRLEQAQNQAQQQEKQNENDARKLDTDASAGGLRAAVNDVNTVIDRQPPAGG